MMMRSMLGDIEAAGERLSRTQEKLSSGRELTKPSDDPTAVGQALQMRSDLAANQQYQRNVDDATSWQQATDDALGQISDLVMRARELVLHGANEGTGTTGRAADASELNQIIEAIKSEANTQYAGRYIFAGSATQKLPYAAGTDDTYYGDTATMKREIGPGVLVDVNTTGSSVVGDANGGLLKALRGALDDLQNGNTTNLQNGDLTAIDTASDTILNARTIVGARQQRLDIATGRLQQLEQVSTGLLSNVEDADMAKTLVNYSQQQAVYQAALRAGAQLIQPSLMDFLR
jgi:flagellar hook-associated protein 3 FlgL